MQTVYAELVERAFVDAFDATFPPERGAFELQTRRGRRYWYFRRTSGGKQRRDYVGPDLPALRARVEGHRRASAQARERTELVQTLKRARLPAPDPASGAIIAALARAGAFRLRAVLIGTHAYGCYGGLLGIRLPAASVRTQDVDLAQAPDVSVLVNDRLERSMLDVLRDVDPSFRENDAIADRAGGHAFVNAERFRVEILASNRGPDRDKPIELPALAARGLPLRFLDFLLYEPVEAVVLHDAGIPVIVPDPARYAVHKLIVSRRRRGPSLAKVGKDLAQAAALVEALVERQPAELRARWAEAAGRGPAWRRLLGEGLEMLPADLRLRLAAALPDAGPTTPRVSD